MHIYAGTFSKIFKIFKKHIYAGTEENVDLQRKLQFHLIKKHIYGGIKNKNFKISHNAYICRSIHMPVHHCIHHAFARKRMRFLKCSSLTQRQMTVFWISDRARLDIYISFVCMKCCIRDGCIQNL